MDIQRRSLQIGAAVIVCAIVLRLGCGGAFGKMVDLFSSPKAMSVLLYLETGRVVRAQPPTSSATAQQPEQPATEISPDPSDSAVAVFAQTDAALVSVNSVCGYEADVPALLSQPLSWDLTQQAPTVLILHSHGTESYTKTEDYQESSAYRTLDEAYNVVSVGTALTQILEAGGIKVIHDTQMHDHPSYNNSYNSARSSIREYLEQYPSIALVLDIHRDAVQTDSGDQKKYTVTRDGQQLAQLMLVVGTDAGGLDHPNWSDNMSLAVKLYAQLEKNCSGICRPISFRSQRFNQDLSPGALLIEVGSAGNTRQEALAAAQVLGQAIITLSNGATTDG